MTTPSARFGVTETEHENCDECQKQAVSAAVHAHATGSKGATYTTAGTVHHSATVVRIVSVVNL